MPREILVGHKLTQEEALHRIHDLLGQIRKDYGNKITIHTDRWHGNTYKFSFSDTGHLSWGSLLVTSTEVKLTGFLPFIYNSEEYREKIRQQLEKVLT